MRQKCLLLLQKCIPWGMVFLKGEQRCDMGYHSALKEMKIVLFVMTWTNLESMMLSEVSQTEKDTYIMISFTCRIIYKQNPKQTKQLKS